jgi:glycerophosphoryl diester phosphodiesterase
MSGPCPEAFPFLDFEGTIAFAHRGGTSTAPENTLASFENAVSLGYRYLETDVHVTADNVLVAFHDHSLERVTGDKRQISAIEWAELIEIKFDGHSVPRMDELLRKFPHARFNIEPKADSAVDPLAKLIQDNDAIDRVCIGAFSDARIARIRELLGPRLCTSPGPRSALSALLPWPLQGEHPCVNVPNTVGSYRLGKRVVRRYQKQGYRVHVWTVNDKAEMHRLIDLGVDGIMTDECELLKQVLLSRGLWN